MALVGRVTKQTKQFAGYHLACECGRRWTIRLPGSLHTAERVAFDSLATGASSPYLPFQSWFYNFSCLEEMRRTTFTSFADFVPKLFIVDGAARSSYMSRPPQALLQRSHFKHPSLFKTCVYAFWAMLSWLGKKGRACCQVVESGGLWFVL